MYKSTGGGETACKLLLMDDTRLLGDKVTKEGRRSSSMRDEKRRGS